MTLGGALYSLTSSGGLCPKLNFFSIFIHQTPFADDTTYNTTRGKGQRRRRVALQCTLDGLSDIHICGFIKAAG